MSLLYSAMSSLILGYKIKLKNLQQENQDKLVYPLPESNGESYQQVKVHCLHGEFQRMIIVMSNSYKICQDLKIPNCTHINTSSGYQKLTQWLDYTNRCTQKHILPTWIFACYYYISWVYNIHKHRAKSYSVASIYHSVAINTQSSAHASITVQEK